MNILAVETGTSLQSITILSDDRVLAHTVQEAQKSHTKILLPGIHTLLSSLQMRLSDLHGLAVSIGPGSFSGLRVGLAVMTGFRLALQIPLVTISSLEAMAWNLRDQKSTICPILKARNEVVYWACYRWEEKNLIQLSPEQVGSPLDLVQSLTGPTVVCGEGWVANRNAFLNMTNLLEEASEEAMAASAVNVGLASLTQFKMGNFAECGKGPHYIQQSYAEMNK